MHAFGNYVKLDFIFFFKVSKNLPVDIHLRVIWLLISREVNVILTSTTCTWINIFVDSGTTLQSTNHIWGI